MTSAIINTIICIKVPVSEIHIRKCKLLQNCKKKK